MLRIFLILALAVIIAAVCLALYRRRRAEKCPAKSVDWTSQPDERLEDKPPLP